MIDNGCRLARIFGSVLIFVASVLTMAAVSASAAESSVGWPDLTKPARTVGGGRDDVALLIGIEDYVLVPRVEGARENVESWYRWMLQSRGVPIGNIRLVLDQDASVEGMRNALQEVVAKANPAGTLWIVFVGHGAPSSDGHDGLLIGMDARQTVASLQDRSFSRNELMRIAQSSSAGQVRIIIDACFSGLGTSGKPIVQGLQPIVLAADSAVADPRFVVMTAAKEDQYAGPLPGATRPAFSYLVLGALRGWADSNLDGMVTAAEAHGYVEQVFSSIIRDRKQQPTLVGEKDSMLSPATGEPAPDLGELILKLNKGFAVETQLPTVPKVSTVRALDADALKFDLNDVENLQEYDRVIRADRSGLTPMEKARAWRDLAIKAPKYEKLAISRAQEWEKYQAEMDQAEQIRRQRAESRDRDWEKLRKALPLEVVPEDDKRQWAKMFVDAYGTSLSDNPYASLLAPYLPRGTVPVLVEFAMLGGGAFSMGSVSGMPNERPVRRMSVADFELSVTEVTVAQYRRCVEIGVCTEPGPGRDCNWNREGVDDHPINCVDYEQATAFAKWAGGRLPTEVEWEYAAKSGGQDSAYPWGNDSATCQRAIMDDPASGSGCGKGSTLPVCSKPAGNSVQGLCDMAGNVREWTSSEYVPPPTESTSGFDGYGDTTVKMVVRGGSWFNGPKFVRASSRGGVLPTERSVYTGFRVARDAP